jgi:hypothetical protein
MIGVDEFIRIWIPTIQLVVSVLGLVSILLLWWQIRETRIWNKLATQIQLTDTDAIAERQSCLSAACARLGIIRDPIVPATDEEAITISRDEPCSLAVERYLSEMEMLATSVLIGAAHEDFAYFLHGHRLVQAYRLFSTYILLQRREVGEPEVFINLQRLALRWEERRLRDKKKSARQLLRLERRLHQQEERIAKLTRKRDNVGTPPRTIL